MVDIDSIISQHRSGLQDKRVFLAPNIPAKKLSRALATYAHGVKPDDVILLIDDTLFGGAKEGLLVTADHIYGHDIAEEPVLATLATAHNIHISPAVLCRKFMVNGDVFIELSQPEKNIDDELVAFLKALQAAAAGAPEVRTTPSSPKSKLSKAMKSGKKPKVTRGLPVPESLDDLEGITGVAAIADEEFLFSLPVRFADPEMTATFDPSTATSAPPDAICANCEELLGHGTTSCNSCGADLSVALANYVFPRDLDGIWYFSTHRSGLLYKVSRQLFVFDLAWIALAWMEEDTETVDFLYYPSNYDWTHFSEPFHITLEPVQFRQAEELYPSFAARLYVCTPNLLGQALSHCFGMICEGQGEQALEMLQKLKTASSSSGAVDLMIARTLESLGRGKKAASHLAQNWESALCYYPSVILCEFMKYDWHKGAIRLLPDPADQPDKEFREHAQIFRNVAIAKADNDPAGIADAICRAFFSLYDSPEDIDCTWMPLLFKVLGLYINEETSATVAPVIDLITKGSERIYQSGNTELTEEQCAFFLDVMRSFAAAPADTSFDDPRLLESICTLGMLQEDDLDALLTKEAFGEVAEREYEPSATDAPEDWSLPSLMVTEDTAWEVASGEDKMKTDIAVVFSQVRLGESEKEQLLARIRKIRQHDGFGLLDTANQRFLWLAYVTEIELVLRLGDRGSARELLHEARERLQIQLGASVTKLLKYGKEMADLFEAWAHDCATGIEDALTRIPKEHPLLWVHEMTEPVVRDLRSQGSIDGGVDNLQSTVTSLLLELRTGIRLGEQSFDADDMEKQCAGVEIRLTDKELVVAVGGETSAGKTTFLNALFDTDLFFVTQEEATGIPTEIRAGPTLLIKVFGEGGTIAEWRRDQSGSVGASTGPEADREIREAQEFLAKYTAVGSEKTASVDRVEVYLPIAGFPTDLVLVDTPGFNAHEDRSSFAISVIERAHACVFVIDARNALKSQEMGILNATREEVGKMIIVLNKMDLAMGDDELDCDGADAADELILRVQETLSTSFDIPSVHVHPVCSLPEDSVAPEVRCFSANLAVLKAELLQVADENRADLLADGAAKVALRASRVFLDSAATAISDHAAQCAAIKTVTPADPSLFEDEVLLHIGGTIEAEKEHYTNRMIEVFGQEFDGLDDRIQSWLQSTHDKDSLKKSAKSRIGSALKDFANAVQTEREGGLRRVSTNVGGAIADVFAAIYSDLPFEVDYDVAAATKKITSVGLASAKSLGSAVADLDTGDGNAIGGAAAGGTLGFFLGGPLGAAVGAWLGGSVFSKDVDDMRSELWDLFAEHANATRGELLAALYADLDEENESSFIVALQGAVAGQVKEYGNTVACHISEFEKDWHGARSRLDNLVALAYTVRKSADGLNEWRSSNSKM